jgi:ABC-2 type transport system permease protein
MELVKKEIKLKYRRSYLGIFWTLLEPILTTVVLTIVFSNLRGKGDEAFPVYILCARLIYTYFSNSTKAAMKSIRSNSAMIKKVYVPKYIYPLSSVISGYVTFLISLIVLVAVMGVFKVKPTLYLLQAIVPLTIVIIMTLGAGMILSTLAVFFRDLEYLWSVMLMMIMYTSAIFYGIEDIAVKNQWIVKWNPLYAIIHNFRNAIFGEPLDQFSLIYSLVFSCISLLVGIGLFYKKQDEFILNI